MVDWKYLPILNGEVLCLNIERIHLKGPWLCYRSYALKKKHRHFTVKWWIRTTLWAFSKSFSPTHFPQGQNPKRNQAGGIW